MGDLPVERWVPGELLDKAEARISELDDGLQLMSRLSGDLLREVSMYEARLTELQRDHRCSCYDRDVWKREAEKATEAFNQLVATCGDPDTTPTNTPPPPPSVPNPVPSVMVDVAKPPKEHNPFQDFPTDRRRIGG
jgi:hypothetical protein